jgi:hypothetical protein
MPKCPKCESPNVIPIVYGKPSMEAMQKAERGEIILGGCILNRDRKNFQCKDCGTKFK